MYCSGIHHSHCCRCLHEHCARRGECRRAEVNRRVSIEVAAGLTLVAKAVATGNVEATVEPQAIRSWLMAAPLLVSAPERGGERLEQGAQGTEIS